MPTAATAAAVGANPHDVQDRKAGSRMSGGFLRATAVPERLVRTQQQQTKAQLELTRRMTDAVQRHLKRGRKFCLPNSTMVPNL